MCSLEMACLLFMYKEMNAGSEKENINISELKEK